jgi:hypothetical protein
MWLAGVGFALSMLAHLASIVGIAMPGGPAIFALHLGIFAVWIPTVVVMAQTKRLSGRRGSFESVFSRAPRWMNRGRQFIFAYGILNFLLFVATTRTGKLADNDPGLIRGFSGHWMVFYSVAFTVLYSASHDSEARPRRNLV